LSGSGSFRNWLLSIAYRCFLQHQRQLKRRDYLTALLCRNVLARNLGGPRFRKALSMADSRLHAGQD